MKHLQERHIERCVIDASALVAMLIDPGPIGLWIARHVDTAELHAPHLMPYEANNIVRRELQRDAIDTTTAAHAHRSILQLNVELYPHSVTAGRAWELRANVTTYDASYVCIAEALHTPFITLDRRVAKVPGVRCAILTPPSEEGGVSALS